jgi:hypothetical protein
MKITENFEDRRTWNEPTLSLKQFTMTFEWWTMELLGADPIHQKFGKPEWEICENLFEKHRNWVWFRAAKEAGWKSKRQKAHWRLRIHE